MERAILFVVALLVACSTESPSTEAQKAACEIRPGCIWIGTLKPGESVVIQIPILVEEGTAI